MGLQGRIAGGTILETGGAWQQRQGLSHWFWNGIPIMRRSIPWLVLASFAGCGQSDPQAPQQTSNMAVVPSTNAPIIQTSATTAPTGNAAKRITPEEALTLAKELIQKRDINNAFKLLTEAIRLNPKLTEAYVNRAALFTEAKQYARAISDLDAAIRLQPDNAKTLNTRGYLQLLLQNYEKAMADFDSALALDLSYPQPLNNRGLVRIAQEDFDKAVREFDAAIKLDGKYIDAHNNRGFALMRARKFDDAVVSYTKALELDPKYINAWNNRAMAHAQAGRHAEAIADFTKAIELQPATMEYFQQRAEQYAANGQPELARKDLEHVEWSYELSALNRALNASPKDPMNWVARGRHLEAVQRWDEALKNYDDALKLNGNCLEARIGRATVMFHQGHVDEALSICDTILKEGPSREASSVKGDILSSQGKLDEAIAQYKLAQRFDSQVAQVYFQRGQQRKASGEIQQASADLIQAVKMDPSLKDQASDVQVPEDAAPVSSPGEFPSEPGPDSAAGSAAENQPAEASATPPPAQP